MGGTSRRCWWKCISCSSVTLLANAPLYSLPSASAAP